MDYRKFGMTIGRYRTRKCPDCVCYNCKSQKKASYCEKHCEQCTTMEGSGYRDRCLYERLPKEEN